MDAKSQIIPQMEFIRSALLTLVNGVNGQCVMVSNLREMWEQASQDSQRPLVYVCYGGEVPWSSSGNLSAVTHRVSRSWIIGVKQGRGYNQERGQSLAEFLPFVEQVRDAMRAMLGISEDIGNDYASLKPWALGTQVVDGYLMEFTTKNDLPTILQVSEELS